MIRYYNLQYFADKSDKTEKPTGKRREDARKEGQVAKSQEIPTAFQLIFMFFTFRFAVPGMFENTKKLFLFSFELIGRMEYIINVKYITNIITFVLTQILLILMPLFAVAMVVGIVTSFVQVGWHPTAKPLQPKLSKLNPVNGLKRLFSAQALVELGKSILKVVLIGYIFYGDLMNQAKKISLLLDMTLFEGMAFIGNIVIDLGIKIGGYMLIVAALDYAFQKYKHEKELKMSKQEVKDEYKNSEGDPQIKGKIRARMREASMRRMMKEIPTADVIITNPTHYAVAVKYDKIKADAPYVVAKGVDFLAKRIKDIGRENDVEIVENRPLARALYDTVEVEQVIPPELYQAVAEVLAFAYSLKSKAN